ncbi:molybdopterin converting factor subunit 1 [Fictibacillus phosphorivorans]|uniref:molybdopterin converting factor subunit 1 n=1 Tax=Fictibacillus phosphorivorans TaxID=1221500 RepID=UPI00203DFF50|nr:molybdopterin converting factor subunit 1 [Fictibacillus phosphorivorans]MCM3719096.1 molybdopterin converting factor subunit 1 [Fictibacillus phosphorivorans]MCM3776718.1 molybdopterin converting factor subunit 1 [Fictibacillus phosphorivorans]
MVQILLFASLAQQAGTQSVSWKIESPVTVGQVRGYLQDHVGELPGIENALVAVNEEYADQEVEIKNGDTVAFIPPVSGG